MDDNSENTLGKPVSSWKTAVARIVGGIGIVFSTASVAIGAYSLITGHKGLGTGIEKRFVKAFEHEAASAARKIGAGIAGIGIVGGLMSKAIWDSAGAAGRMRNYLRLSQQLDAKETGAERD